MVQYYLYIIPSLLKTVDHCIGVYVQGCTGRLRAVSH